eukprot:CAMPEP_0175324000 /NCGR_PEP_ID=MMETSP0093-20121207/73265_1 /TAXON_ID=311494 /ORGANISM="Alexandrium monilatum, Strain CCMP3105" /LENGTH=70 /DNA_ID=CAMNT_0016620907 /DNA_START=120 /DNA_END=332 /DNA_ORIENTATION=+
MARAQRAHRVACVRLKVKLCPPRLRQSPLAWHRRQPGPAMEERLASDRSFQGGAGPWTDHAATYTTHGGG